MSKQNCLKKHYLEKFLYGCRNNHISIPISSHQESPMSQINIRHDNHEFTNHHKALSLLINENPDSSSHNKAQKTRDKYGCESNESDSKIDPANIVDSIIEKEQPCVDDKDDLEQDLSLLFNYVKETSRDPTQLNTNDGVERFQQSITSKQEYPSNYIIPGSGSSSYNNYGRIRFDNDQEFSEGLITSRKV